MTGVDSSHKITGNSRRLIRAVTHMHTRVYQMSGGRVMGWVQGTRVLLLSTTGRKTGRCHTMPLGSVSDGENHVVVASNGGKHWHPDWWLNLKSNQDALIEVGIQRMQVIAYQAHGQEAVRLGMRFPWLHRYQKRTNREIPVVILRPVT